LIPKSLLIYQLFKVNATLFSQSAKEKKNLYAFFECMDCLAG